MIIYIKEESIKENSYLEYINTFTSTGEMQTLLDKEDFDKIH
jgi:hypothetical protein